MEYKLGVAEWLVIGATIAIGLIGWGLLAQKGGVPEVEMSAREVALLCTTDMATKYHIHPELRIVINGVETPLPSNIGIQPTCMNSIHTHEGGGVIHVESPVPKDFTLGDFFAVWQKEFSREQVLDARVDERSEILVTINGERVETYEDTVLKDKDKIVISYTQK